MLPTPILKNGHQGLVTTVITKHRIPRRLEVEDPCKRAVASSHRPLKIRQESLPSHALISIL